jgi:MFS family permease
MTLVAPLVPLHRNRDFVLLWSGQAISTLGSNISWTAFPLLVLALTDSPAAAGVVGFAAGLPRALIQLPAGAMVDRLDRRRVMIVADLVRAAALIGLVVGVWRDWASVPLLATVACVEGVCNVFFNLAHTGAIRNVVPNEQMVTALSQSEARVRAAELAGLPLGGWLFGLGQLLPFLVDAASYLVSLVSLALIRRPFNQERTGERRALRDEIAEGITWLWHQRFLRATLLLVAGSNVALRGLILAVIVISRDAGATSQQIGLLLGGFGVGGLLGAAAAPWRHRGQLGLGAVDAADSRPTAALPAGWGRCPDGLRRADLECDP